MQTKRPSVFNYIKRFIVGKAHDPTDPTLFHKLTLIALFAWIGLGADPLSSSAYGPEEAFKALAGHNYLVVFVALFIVVTIFIISASYSQLIEVFPSGGGGYLVASKLLSPFFGMVSGSALLIDYVLTITVSIAAGADAAFSFIPVEYHYLKITFGIGCIMLLILLNLRGVKESILVLFPIFMVFVITHLFLIGYAFLTHFADLPGIVQGTGTEFSSSLSQLGLFGVLWLILHAYSMGAGTFTGIEAVSNGMPILREPKVKTAKKTIKYMAASLAFMVLGLMFLYLVYEVSPVAGKTMNAAAFEKITFSWGTFGYYFLLVTLISEAALLFVAAQTGFLDGPRILGNMALDKWVPVSFSTLSDRLVTEKGILLMGIAAIALMLISQGSIALLVVLYSINVFITFVLSQAGMVHYWWTKRFSVKRWKRKLMINGIGLLLTLFILLSVIIVKFNEGAWITLIITGTVIGLVSLIKLHYKRVEQKVAKLDFLVKEIDPESMKCFMFMQHNTAPVIAVDKNAKTAVVLVSGYNGVGLEAVSSIFKLFGDTFKNFVFISVGVIDAGTFKGTAEVIHLNRHIKIETEKYVKILKGHGYHSECMTSMGTDVVDKVNKIALLVRHKYPNSVFFGGQVVFENETFFTKMLHNYTVFSIERRLFQHGIPFIALPIKV